MPRRSFPRTAQDAVPHVPDPSLTCQPLSHRFTLAAQGSPGGEGRGGEGGLQAGSSVCETGVALRWCGACPALGGSEGLLRGGADPGAGGGQRSSTREHSSDVTSGQQLPSWGLRP